jgi:hypothetical protein
MEKSDIYNYITEPPKNDDFEIGQWVLCTERKRDEIFKVFEMSQDWLFDRGYKQYDPNYCEVIILTNDPRILECIQ